MNWNNFTNMMPDANRINQLANMAQTVGQFATSAQRFIGTTIAETNETAIGRAKTELQFIEPVIGGPSNQNLFDGFTREFLKCLMFAGGVGNATAARALLEERRADRDGCTPLLCAVKRNDLDGALQLLAYGADPHRADANGDTPLHHAVMASSVQIVKLLLCFGANLNVPNNAGQTANSLKIKNRQLADEIISRARMWMQHGVCSAGDIQDNCSSKVDSKRDVAIARVAREQQHLALLYQQHRTTSLSAGGGGDDRMSSNALRLLSLDGGGIRGLVLIQVSATS
uniref:ANK_REP_REGION domain-containing protein n=1 Tax=Globodera rostochiensis TaxID=31243 RepID=A0A914HMY2_GLORO